MSDKKPVSTPDELLVPAMGAVVFASGEPVHPSEILDSFPDLEPGDVEAAFQALQQDLDRSSAGLRLECVAGGYRLSTRPEVGALVRNFFRRRHRARLSPASLETLAMVAYRQPITAPEIQAIRGKDSSASLKNLLDKKLLRILGRKKVVGSPLLYGTSKHFLVHFGLNSLEDLPAIEDFDTFVDALESGPEAPAPADDESLPTQAEVAADQDAAKAETDGGIVSSEHAP